MPTELAKRFRKDPDAVLDYKFDWRALANGTGKSNWLAPAETIVAFEVTPTEPVTVPDADLTDDATSVTAWLAGGIAGTDYEVTCHITTSAGRVDERTLILEVRER